MSAAMGEESAKCPNAEALVGGENFSAPANYFEVDNGHFSTKTENERFIYIFGICLVNRAWSGR
jgi:hypothetical protein